MARIVVCKECGEEKPHYARGSCAACYQRQYREAHREHRREYNRQYREANPGYHRQYHEAHRQERNEASRQWNEAHLDQVRERGRQWRQVNPEKKRRQKRRHRARKRNATVGPVNEAAIYGRDGHMCMYCGATYEPLTLDHIAPLAKGGVHCKDNLVTACRRCNSRKHTKPLGEWLQTQPYSIAWLF